MSIYTKAQVASLGYEILHRIVLDFPIKNEYFLIDTKANRVPFTPLEDGRLVCNAVL